MKEEGAGGNAIKSSESINGRLAGEFGKKIVDSIKNKLGIDACTLGSTGKKPDTQTSGDIDIAIEMPYSDENVNKITKFLHDEYGDVEIYLIKGLRILSFGYKYEYENSIKIVQVDLMFCNDVRYAAFMYHSPNYINNESKFKGLFRTNLLVICASKMPVNTDKYPTEYYDDGEIKTFWKYSLSYSEGLRLVHKSYVGKSKRLKNPNTIKEDTIEVTKDIDDIIHCIFGINATADNMNSFESIVEYLYSDKYAYKSKERLDEIFTAFFDDSRHQGNDLITEQLHAEIDKYKK